MDGLDGIRLNVLLQGLLIVTYMLFRYQRCIFLTILKHGHLTKNTLPNIFSSC